ncbi:hypothetical protein BKA69DRAFT_1108154 [Paraphysoderma sedebokerense]|nr:hypothetical protein BKA69DRAFT_1108154 [Paraphysoderma sedebokerense]
MYRLSNFNLLACLLSTVALSVAIDLPTATINESFSASLKLAFFKLTTIVLFVLLVFPVFPVWFSANFNGVKSSRTQERLAQEKEKELLQKQEKELEQLKSNLTTLTNTIQKLNWTIQVQSNLIIHLQNSLSFSPSKSSLPEFEIKSSSQFPSCPPSHSELGARLSPYETLFETLTNQSNQIITLKSEVADKDQKIRELSALLENYKNGRKELQKRNDEIVNALMNDVAHYRGIVHQMTVDSLKSTVMG